MDENELLTLTSSYQLRYRIVLDPVKFKKYRKELNLSGTKLAKKIGICPQQMYQLEKGLRPVPGWIQDAIVKVFTREARTGA